MFPLFSRLIHDPAHQRTVYTFCVIPLVSQTTHRQVYSKKEDKLRDLLSFVMLVGLHGSIQERRLASLLCVLHDSIAIHDASICLCVWWRLTSKSDVDCWWYSPPFSGILHNNIYSDDDQKWFTFLFYVPCLYRCGLIHNFNFIGLARKHQIRVQHNNTFQLSSSSAPISLVQVL